MSCNRLLRWALPFSIAGLGAGPVVPCLRNVGTRDLSWLSGPPCKDFQAIPASIPPLQLKNCRDLNSAAATLPVKSS